jgi:hypothetical protein
MIEKTSGTYYSGLDFSEEQWRGKAMRKSVLLTAVVVFIVCGLAWGLAMAEEEEMCVPMGDITLESIAPEAQRESVIFPHATHFTFDCRECHHKWDYKTAILNCTTSGCHDLVEAPRNEDGRLVNDPALTILYFKSAYHEKCLGCHKEIKQQNKRQEATKTALGEQLQPAGPTGCIECHPKY